MNSLLVLARIALSIVFVTAARAKFLDPQGTRRAARDLGVPEAMTGVAALLPLTEVAVAVLLLPVPSAPWGAVAALGLLFVFTVIVAGNLLLGRRPPCRCFGSADTSPIGWPTLVRNSVLLAMAAFVVWAGPGPSIVAPFTGGPPSGAALVSVGVALVVAVAVQGWMIVHLVRQQGRLLLRMDALETATGAAVSGVSTPIKDQRGLPVGTEAPGFRLPSLTGGSVGLDDLCNDGRDVLLVFLDPECRPCLALVPDIDRWQREHHERSRIAVVGTDWEKAPRSRDSVSTLRDVLSDDDDAVSDAYGVFITPAAVLVDAVDRTIGSPLATGGEAITRLVARMADMPAK